MRLTLDIKDANYSTFLEFIKTLDYISINPDTGNIPQWQQDQANKRLKSYFNNPDQATDFEDAMSDIEKDL